MNIGASFGSLAVQRPQRPDKNPEERFKSLDTQSRGYITQSEFERSTINISAQAAWRAGQEQAGAAAFARPDSDQDSKLRSAEFRAGAAQGPPPGQGQSGGPPGAQGGSRPPPPPGAAGNAPAGSNGFAATLAMRQYQHMATLGAT